MSYKEVAKLLGYPKAWRAVGNALNKNKDKKVPCHRVVKTDGKVGGFSSGQKRKIGLLKKEGVIIQHNKVVH